MPARRALGLLGAALAALLPAVPAAALDQAVPAFDALCRDASTRQFDVVMAWSVDRLGRSLQDLIAFLSELHALKVDLFLKSQGIDTTTPGGKAMFQMMGVFAEFERSIIQERVRAGLRRATFTTRGTADGLAGDGRKRETGCPSRLNVNALPVA